MLPSNKFNGELNGKTIKDFTDKLDYELNQKDRIELVNNILNTQVVKGKMLPDEYFEDFFEQKDLVNGIDFSHIKICLNQKDAVSEGNPICKSLNRMADYILYAPDAERIDMKVKYNFYTEAQFKNQLKKEESIEKMSENQGTEINFQSNEVIDFLIRKGNNYKTSIQQKILKSDLSKDNLKCLHDYEKCIEYLKQEVRLEKEKQDKVNYKIKKCVQLISGMMDDEIYCKDKINGTIYFKECLSDSTQIDYDKFDFENLEHLSCLLKVGYKEDFDDDLACLTMDLNNLLKQIELSDIEKEVLNLWKINDNTQEKIAGILGVSQPYVHCVIKQICVKIATKYRDDYEEWYYTFIEKGTYKKCSRCGEIKLINKFYPKKDNSDGLHKKCIKCMTKS